tara:strand:+ start:247 stop:1173 length:927 start_codon:yes stop_codon:yes gene_type:complete
MKNFKIVYLLIFYSIFLINTSNSIENKILFKVNNEIITSLDIYNELIYLESINDKFKNTKKKQALEIAKRSLIREKIKEIELKKLFKELKIEDKYLNNVLVNYYRNKQINSISDLESYFDSTGINPNLIKKKITIEILWNQLIFDKYSQSVKIDKQKIIDNLEKDNKRIEFFLSEILFNVNKNEKLHKKFNLIKDKINKSNFSEAALIYSISDTANKNGELGWIKMTALSEKIRIALQNITIGNYTNPIVIPGGFLILKIKDIREIDNNFDQDEEIKKVIKKKTNDQLNQFSNIFFNKIRKDIVINEL